MHAALFCSPLAAAYTSPMTRASYHEAGVKRARPSQRFCPTG